MFVTINIISSKMKMFGWGESMKKLAVLGILVVVVMGIFALGGCSNIAIYEPTKTSFDIAVDDNLNLSGKDYNLLSNPDRGFRGEMYITLGRGGEAYPESKSDPYEQINKELSYEGTSTQIIQTYVYLIEFYNSDLPDSALEEMTKFFMAIKATGAKMLLRFAYEYTDTSDIGPTTKQIVRHCQQLKVWFEKNETLAYQSIYAVQFGLIGLWGEGHGSVFKHSETKLLNAFNDMVPSKLPVMVRYPRFVKKAPKEMEHRLSIHDDFLVGVDHPWGITVPFDDPDYPKLLNLARHQITDGEMPWGRDKTVDTIDNVLFLRQVVSYGLTSLSIMHNYMEEPENYKNFELWQSKNVFLTESELIEYKIPYNPKMLDGGKISVFDYLNYHLGYQIGLSNFSLQNGKLQFLVNNFGIACPKGYVMQVVVDGIVVDSISANDMQLYQFGQYEYSLENSGANSNSKIGIKFFSERDGRTFKLANNVNYYSGINEIFN